MSTATLIERITGRRRAAEQKSIDSYRDLVIAVADDESAVDPARADAIMLDAAKTPAQLASDVAELRQRRVDAELAATLPGLQKQRAELCAKQRTLREALREAEQKYRDDSLDARRRLAQLDNEVSAAEQAARRLRAGRPDPREAELRAELSRLNQRRSALMSEIGDSNAVGLRGRLHNLRLALKAGPQPDPGGCDGSLVPSIVAGLAFNENQLRDGIAVIEGELRGRETELAMLDTRVAEVNSALTAIQKRQEMA